MHVTRAPGALITYALGSCIGVCIYDQRLKLAGMVHIMLPTMPDGSADNVLKYADTGIPALLKKMQAFGASPMYMSAKIAGGATMFKVADNSIMGNIGKRNAETVKETLQKNRIRIVAEDTGSNYARTMEFYADTGEALIRSYGRPDSRL